MNIFTPVHLPPSQAHHFALTLTITMVVELIGRSARLSIIYIFLENIQEEKEEGREGPTDKNFSSYKHLRLDWDDTLICGNN